MQATKMNMSRTVSQGSRVAITPGYPAPLASLTKTDLKRLEQRQAELESHRCEKLDALRQEHEQASSAFDQARQDRANKSTDDEARNQLIKDKLAALKAKTDRDANKQNEVVKAFNHEFSAIFAERKQGWENTHDDFNGKFADRTASIDDETSELAKAIEEEHRACVADTDAEINRIRDVEKEHSDLFERLVADRAKEHNTFKADLGEAFGDIRRRLARERQARESQAKQTHDSAKEGYMRLAEQIQSLSAELQKKLQDLQARLAEENQERSVAQERVVDDMFRFIQAIEDNVADNQRGVADTQKLLIDLQAMLQDG